MSLVVLYKGRRGIGKTLTMVKDGFQYYLDGWKVFGNLKTSFSKYISEEDILKLDKSSKLYNCVIMIDEIQIFFDSRRSMKKTSINFSNFIQQIRKRNIIILGTTQFSSTIDLRFRQHSDIIVYPNFNKRFNVCEAVYLDLTTIEDEYSRIKEPKNIKIVYNPVPVFNLFNTNEMIK